METTDADATEMTGVAAEATRLQAKKTWFAADQRNGCLDSSGR